MIFNIQGIREKNKKFCVNSIFRSFKIHMKLLLLFRWAETQFARHTLTYLFKVFTPPYILKSCKNKSDFCRYLWVCDIVLRPFLFPLCFTRFMSSPKNDWNILNKKLASRVIKQNNRLCKYLFCFDFTT